MTCEALPGAAAWRRLGTGPLSLSLYISLSLSFFLSLSLFISLSISLSLNLFQSLSISLNLSLSLSQSLNLSECLSVSLNLCLLSLSVSISLSLVSHAISMCFIFQSFSLYASHFSVSCLFFSILLYILPPSPPPLSLSPQSSYYDTYVQRVVEVCP